MAFFLRVRVDGIGTFCGRVTAGKPGGQRGTIELQVHPARVRPQPVEADDAGRQPIGLAQGMASLCRAGLQDPVVTVDDVEHIELAIFEADAGIHAEFRSVEQHHALGSLETRAEKQAQGEGGCASPETMSEDSIVGYAGTQYGQNARQGAGGLRCQIEHRMLI